MVKREYPDCPQVAVGAVVFRDDRVLLVERGRPPGKGLWAIPGGRVKLGETLQEAAEREVKEEAGVIIRAKNPVYAFDAVHRDDQGRIRFHYVIVDLLADYISGTQSPNSDVQGARWVTTHELEKLFPVSKSTREVLKNIFGFGVET
jgi:ADP-ribose pyrophosphatase